jgi:hypothetical protein
MAKQKVGLHKQVSQIFDGVPIPKESGPQKPAKTPVSSRLDFLRPTRRESTPTSSFRPPLRLPTQVGAAGKTEAGADTKPPLPTRPSLRLWWILPK